MREKKNKLRERENKLVGALLDGSRLSVEELNRELAVTRKSIMATEKQIKATEEEISVTMEEIKKNEAILDKCTKDSVGGGGQLGQPGVDQG
eukprot:CAMPEP_0184480376 /NCGR_PEP_ID=MMETSP0113_2-20130426/1881_1 /TAXON_ID=91329 /ORGANISM="Norrisiella sphaerica, Strain BC52" /LENGTH=91 /DNA_ID=CAMNT_0026858815 /DNA_START=683 /DNA_END=955 /DNA_ORIENTATION=-